MKDFLALNMDAGERQAFASVGRCIYCGGSGVAALSIYLIGLHRPARASKVRHELGAAVAREQLGAVCQPPQRRFCAI